MAQCDTQQGPVINPPAPPSPGGGSVLIVNVDDETDGVLDKTFKEIYEAYIAGTTVIVISGSGEYAIGRLVTFSGYNEIAQQYMVATLGGTFTCSSANDYPVYEDSYA